MLELPSDKGFSLSSHIFKLNIQLKFFYLISHFKYRFSFTKWTCLTKSSILKGVKIRIDCKSFSTPANELMNMVKHFRLWSNYIYYKYFKCLFLIIYQSNGDFLVPFDLLLGCFAPNETQILYRCVELFLNSKDKSCIVKSICPGSTMLTIATDLV